MFTLNPDGRKDSGTLSRFHKQTRLVHLACGSLVTRRYALLQKTREKKYMIY